MEVNVWNHLALPVYFHQESIIVYIYSFQTLRLCTFLYLLTVFENNNIYFNLGIRQFYYYYITCYTDNSIQVHEVWFIKIKYPYLGLYTYKKMYFLKIHIFGELICFKDKIVNLKFSYHKKRKNLGFKNVLYTHKYYICMLKKTWKCLT